MTRVRHRGRERRRFVFVAAAALVIAVAAVGIFEASTVVQQNSLIGRPVTAQDYQKLDRIATSSSFGATVSFLTEPPYVTSVAGQQWSVGSKPLVVYVGAEYCSNCAFMRWPLIIALMRFGNFTGLSYMQSSSGVSYPDADTFTFHGSSYSSQYLVFQPFEAQTRNEGTPLQTVPSNYTGALSSYGGTYPFIDIANKFMVGDFYDAKYLGSGAGGNWTRDIESLSANSTLSFRVMASANAITALICSVTSNRPVNVCTNPALVAYRGFAVPEGPVSSPGLSVIQGGSSVSTQMPSNMRYCQAPLGPKGWPRPK